MESLTFDERDEFQRRVIAEKAITLLCSEIEVSPIVINGDWGTGKTEFCHKLMNLMKIEDTHHLIYVDAFLADHSDEPLLTVLSEVLKIIPEGDERNGFMQKALPTIRYGLKTIAKAGVSHILRQEAADVIDDFDKEIQKVTDKAIDASVESMLKDHIKASESLKTLQAALKDIATKKPIVLFIDELDRCRPSFAVNLLEVIKHTFDVDGVQFVLVTNTQQLKASINHCYGDAVDSQRYLDKFLKFTFSLPNQFNLNLQEQTETSLSHYRNLLRQSPALKEAQLEQEAFLDFLGHLIKLRSISLREVETLVRHIEIYQVLTEGKGLAGNIIFGYKLLRLLAVVLYCFEPGLAWDISKGKANAKDLASFFGEESIVTFNGDYPYPEHYETVLVMIGEECHKNNELFTPTEENRVQWNDLIRSYFNKGGFPPDKGQRSRILVEVINTLSLYK
jgi:hypothetical protein